MTIAAERALLAYIDDRAATRQLPPTRKEMGAALGCSTTYAHKLLHRLRDQGQVEFNPYQHRSVKIVRDKLTHEEQAWCERNVGRVRAAMQMDARGGAERRAEGRVAA